MWYHNILSTQTHTHFLQADCMKQTPVHCWLYSLWLTSIWAEILKTRESDFVWIFRQNPDFSLITAAVLTLALSTHRRFVCLTLCVMLLYWPVTPASLLMDGLFHAPCLWKAPDGVYWYECSSSCMFPGLIMEMQNWWFPYCFWLHPRVPTRTMNL